LKEISKLFTGNMRHEMELAIKVYLVEMQPLKNVEGKN
jgi:hypothetical protein